MITFPCCKLNLGLNIIAKRDDGYHDIETVFHPLPLTDALEVKKMAESFPSPTPCDLKITGNAVDCDEQQNLVVKAYHLLAKNYELPRIHAHLCKRIPSQAGLGGGSADGAFMLKLLDERFRLNMGIAEMERYAAQLGSDCPFFISAEPSFATGRGEKLSPVSEDWAGLQGYQVALVKPPVAVSTAEAYAGVTPRKPAKCCRDIVQQPIDTWRNELVNDFEPSVFAKLPVLAEVKQKLYDLGAIYASMSGSGSTIFGIFRKAPENLQQQFGDSFTATLSL